MGQLSTALDVVGLEKRYGRRTVLSLDLQLEPGDFCVMLGENGAGKSTFFRCLLGLERFSGAVRVPGGAPRGAIAGVLDEPMMYPTWTAAQFIEYALGAPSAVRHPVVTGLVGRDLLRQRIGRLSTGQKKLVLLAATLAGTARVILLDEFANGLDQEARRRFRAVVREELARGRTIIATGHDLDAFGELPNRVVILRDGELLDITSDYLSGKDLARVYEKHLPRADA